MEITSVLKNGSTQKYFPQEFEFLTDFSHREKELAIGELEMLLILLFLLYMPMPKRHFVCIYTGNERNIKSTDAISFN